jgi:hypothetical protein
LEIPIQQCRAANPLLAYANAVPSRKLPFLKESSSYAGKIRADSAASLLPKPTKLVQKMKHPSSDVPQNLDPADWNAFRAQAHLMLDHTQTLGQRALWQPLPVDRHAQFRRHSLSSPPTSDVVAKK